MPFCYDGGIKIEEGEYFYMPKLRKLILICSAVILLFLALPGFLFVLPQLREWSIRQQFSLIDGGSWVMEESARYGANVAQASVYYWIDKPLSEVRTYYQSLTTPFQKSGDDFGEWEIALIRRGNTGFATLNALPRSISHGSLCHDRPTYDCLTVALVSADQSERHAVGAMSPSSFRRSSEPAALAELPRRGTIIIYSYDVPDW